MKKLSLKPNAFSRGEVLTRAQLKKVMGGDGSGLTDVCQGLVGQELTECRYNVCMAGWDSSVHTEKQNKDKIDSCCSLSGNC